MGRNTLFLLAAILSIAPNLAASADVTTHILNPYSKSGYINEDLVANDGSDPSNNLKAMKGLLDFLRNDRYHKGPFVNQNYVPWMTPHYPQSLDRSPTGGIGYQEFEEGGTKLARISKYGFYADRHILPYLDGPAKNDDALASFLFMKAYNKALEKIFEIQEAQQEQYETYQEYKKITEKLIADGHPEEAAKIPPMEPVKWVNWVKKTYSSSKIPYFTIVDPRLANALINPQQILDQLLLGKSTPAVKDSEGEHQQSVQYMDQLNELFNKQTGHAVKYIDPTLIMNLRNTTDPHKTAALKSDIESALINNLSDRIIDQFSASDNFQLFTNHSSSSGKFGHNAVDEKLNELFAPMDTAKPGETKESGQSVANESGVTPPDYTLSSLNKDERNQNIYLSLCIKKTYENLLAFRKSPAVSTDAFLAELDDYAEHCYNLFDSKTQKDAEWMHPLVTRQVLGDHILHYQIPKLRAKSIQGHAFDPAMKFEAEVMHAVMGDNLEKTAVEDIDRPFGSHKNSLTHDPLDPNFWNQGRDQGTFLNRFGISILADECNKPQKITTQNVIKTSEDFVYTNCPALRFASNFMEHADEFLNNAEAVASVYDLMTASGVNPQGAKDFKNLMVAIEFHRRVAYAKALSDGKVTAPYQLPAIFDFSKKENIRGLGFVAGTLVCAKKPPYALTNEEDCGENAPSLDFQSALTEVGKLSAQFKIGKYNPAQPNKFDVSGDFRDNEMLRDPLIVGSNVFVLANTDITPARASKASTSAVKIYDEKEHSVAVNQKLEDLKKLSDDVQKSVTLASGKINSINGIYQKSLESLNHLVLPEYWQSKFSTELNDTMFDSIQTFADAKELYSYQLGQLGIRVQHQGIYKQKPVKHMVTNEHGQEEEKIFQESEACANGTADPKMMNESDHFASSMARYQYLYTCYTQNSASLINDGLDQWANSVDQAGSDIAWTAATIATLPIGGTLTLGAKALTSGSINAVRAVQGLRSLKYARMLIKAANTSNGAARLFKTGRLLAIGRQAIADSQLARAAFSQAFSATEFAALRSIGLTKSYAMTTKQMGSMALFMKFFGGFGLAMQVAREKYHGHIKQPGETQRDIEAANALANSQNLDALVGLFVGGQTPGSLAETAGMMMFADNAALVIKNMRLSAYLKHNPGKLPTDQVNKLRLTSLKKALPDVPPEIMKASEASKYLKMSPKDFAALPDEIQQSFLWYKYMRMSAAELERQPQAVQTLVGLKKLDLNSTAWGNHIAGDIALSLWFERKNWLQRNATNEKTYASIKQAEANIEKARKMKDQEAINNWTMQKEGLEAKIQGTFWGLDAFDLSMDVFFAVKFRHARPGDFGHPELFSHFQQNMDNVVNTAIRLPSSKKIEVTPEGKTLYNLSAKDYDALAKALAEQEAAFYRAASPEDLATAPGYNSLAVIGKNPDGSYTISTDPSFKGWWAYRFRDQVPQAVKDRINQLSRGMDPAQPNF